MTVPPLPCGEGSRQLAALPPRRSRERVRGAAVPSLNFAKPLARLSWAIVAPEGRAGFAAALMLATAPAHAARPQPEAARWATRASHVTIARDDWGIPHVTGRTDADSIFGLVYAQAEDDFPRIERNYAEQLGWLARADGEAAIWSDLRARLWHDEAKLKRLYAAAPPKLHGWAEAWADGLNFFLARHPEQKPRYILRFEPWMVLAFTEGSIGGDIEEIDLAKLRDFYGQPGDRKLALAAPRASEDQGSNGIAIAPSLTANGHALLLINPHTSHYFRSEAQMTSGEGLNAYGASTWGQFFVYQGFNASAGWMHTTSSIVRITRYREAVTKRADGFYAASPSRPRKIGAQTVSISFKSGSGGYACRSFTVYRTRHGPVVAREADGRWQAVAIMDRPVEALRQSFERTKAADWAAFQRVAELKANSSNNTLFADANGTIAFKLPDHVPVRRAPGEVADGESAEGDWTGLTALSAIPQAVNPESGFVYNVNDAPWDAAGPGTIRRDAFPAYMDAAGRNARSLHALTLLPGSAPWTPERLRAAAYDAFQPGFAAAIPPLIAAWDAEPDGPLKAKLAAPIAALRGWDDRWSGESVPQTLAIEWGRGVQRRLGRARDGLFFTRVGEIAPHDRLTMLETAVDRLSADFGRWDVRWGEVNRLQRTGPEIAARYDDTAPSQPVPFASSAWGSLASAKPAGGTGTKRWYVNEGNSFVAVVEFGPRVKAMAVMTGGQSSDPRSRHFFDQAARTAEGALRPVYFHADELAGHVERIYRPGA